MELEALTKARMDFSGQSHCSPDDKMVPDFYEKLHLALSPIPQQEKKTAYIVVAHLVNSLTTFLEALVGDNEIGAVIPKGSQTVAQVADSLKEHYESVLDHGITKDDCFSHPERVSDFLNNFMKKYPPEEYQYEIMDHGGYFAQHMYSLPRAFFDHCTGITEHTLNGHLAYEKVIKNHGQLLAPIFSIARAKVKAQENKEIADCTANAIFTKILGPEGLHRASSRLGKVAIIGAGNIGKSTGEIVATRLQARTKLVICDTNPCACEKVAKAISPIREVEVVQNKAEAIKDADLIFIVTSGVALNADDFISMKSESCIVFGTSSDSVIAQDALDQYETVFSSRYVTRIKNKTNGQILYLAAHGGSVNFIVGSTPHPIIHAALGLVIALSNELKQLAPTEREAHCQAVTACSKDINLRVKAIWEEYYDTMSHYDIFSQLAESGWNLPKNNNNDFVGREAVIKETHSNLQYDRASLITIENKNECGLGLKETATRYLYAYADVYPIRIWLDASSETSLLEEIYLLVKNCVSAKIK
jgi:adenosylhomocysteinase